TPAGGEVSIVEGGVRLHYRPAENFFGTDTFTYSLQNRTDDLATATVTITVTAVADPPAAADDALEVAESSVENVFDVLANDVDADGDPLTVAAVTAPNRGGAAAVTDDGTAIVYSP